MTSRASITLLALLPVLAGTRRRPRTDGARNGAAPAEGRGRGCRPAHRLRPPPLRRRPATRANLSRPPHPRLRSRRRSRLTHDGGADALDVATTGTGRAIDASINNSSNAKAAIRGTSNGSGRGVSRLETQARARPAPSEPNADNAQPALFATTKGSGAAVSGIVTRDSAIDSAGVSGRNNLFCGYGYGGDFRGGFVGVYASASNGYGIYATAPPATSYAGYFSATYIAGNLTYTSDRAAKTDARESTAPRCSTASHNCHCSPGPKRAARRAPCRPVCAGLPRRIRPRQRRLFDQPG